jgi:hypothetical protein
MAGYRRQALAASVEVEVSPARYGALRLDAARLLLASSAERMRVWGTLGFQAQ